MNTKKIVKLFAIIALVSLLFTACGAKEEAPAAAETLPPVQEAAPAELSLSAWTLDAKMWSSANGASIDLTATPTAYTEGMTATFLVRLEGEEVVKNPCEWNGTAFTSYADLNAEDGYCYYVTLTGPDGAGTTLEINTPTKPIDESLIDLAASLESFCHATVVDFTYADNWLTITEGVANIQVPRINADGEALTCHSAELILNLDGVMHAKAGLNDLVAAASSVDGNYALDLSDVSFSVQQIEGDHQLAMTLVAYLSDGSTLTDEGSTSWFYSDGTVNLTVG